MASLEELSGILSRYRTGAGGTAPVPADPHQDYSCIANSVPPKVLADALAHAFRSDQTPSFPETVTALFQQSTPEQQAGLLNELLGLPALRGLTNRFGGRQTISTETAARISPEQVQQIAAHAMDSDAAIVDRVSRYYRRHPDVVKGMGRAAITVAMQHIARSQ